jgi:hypothetical protein
MISAGRRRYNECLGCRIRILFLFKKHGFEGRERPVAWQSHRGIKSRSVLSAAALCNSFALDRPFASIVGFLFMYYVCKVLLNIWSSEILLMSMCKKTKPVTDLASLLEALLREFAIHRPWRCLRIAIAAW